MRKIPSGQERAKDEMTINISTALHRRVTEVCDKLDLAIFQYCEDAIERQVQIHEVKQRKSSKLSRTATFGKLRPKPWSHVDIDPTVHRRAVIAAGFVGTGIGDYFEHAILNRVEADESAIRKSSAVTR